MIQKIFLIFIIGFFFFQSKGQDFQTYLKENAVRIDQPESLSDEIYRLVSDYAIIMVGEMHGTNEPAKFVIGLAELFTKKGDSVQVGIEIPSDQMSKYIS